MEALAGAERVTESSGNDQLLYFTSTSLLADDSGLFFISDRTGDPKRAQVRVFLRRPWEQLPAGRRLDLDVGETDTYRELLHGFVLALTENKPPPVSAHDATEALATALAIYQSSATGRAVDIDHATERQ
jgi:predicted dehydrogenase